MAYREGVDLMIETVLGSRTRAGILRALFADDGRRGLRFLELVRAVGTSVSSGQAELGRLESIGLVRSDRSGEGRCISLVGSHPLAGPLRLLVEADAEADAGTASAAGLHPRIRPLAGAIAEACRRHGAVSAALVGSATQPDADRPPADLDVLVRLDPSPEGYSERYFGLLAELERIMGMPVEIIEEDALRNPYLKAEFEATKVVLYEAA